jgi:TolB protein
VSYVGPSVEGSYLLSLVRADGTGKSLIFEELASHGPVLIWAPDGERAVVANRTDGNSYLASPGDGSYGICLTCGLDAPGTPAPSPDGRRAAVAASDGIYLVALDGSGPSRVASFSRPGRPSWSPDGQALAFDARGDGGPRGIYLLDLRTGETRSLTAALVGEAFAPSWSPDADHIAFHSLDREGLHLMTVTPDEAALALVTDWDLDVEILDPGLLMSPAWSPDGEWIAFAASSTLGDLDIFIVRPDGADLTNITNYPGIDDDPTWSPDGELIAFRTDRDGNWEIYVMASDGSGTVDLSQSPGTDECCPGWRP